MLCQTLGTDKQKKSKYHMWYIKAGFVSNSHTCTQNDSDSDCLYSTNIFNYKVYIFGGQGDSHYDKKMSLTHEPP